MPTLTKIGLLRNSEVISINGENQMDSLTARDTVTDTQKNVEERGLFIAVGNEPRVYLAHGQVGLIPDGTISLEKVPGLTSGRFLPLATSPI